MYSLLIERGAPPVVETKYEFVHKVGNVRLSSPEKLLAQESRRTSFDQLHQPMDTVLRVHTYKQVDVIRQDFKFFDVCLMLLAHVGNDLF